MECKKHEWESVPDRSLGFAGMQRDQCCQCGAEGVLDLMSGQIVAQYNGKAFASVIDIKSNKKERTGSKHG